MGTYVLTSNFVIMRETLHTGICFFDANSFALFSLMTINVFSYFSMDGVKCSLNQ